MELWYVEKSAWERWLKSGFVFDHFLKEIKTILSVAFKIHSITVVYGFI